MNEILRQVELLHPKQRSLPLSILMALRARVEFKAGLSNRIGRVFPHGNRHVLMVGKAGAGKTRLLRIIYNGLGLDGYNRDGNRVGKWVSSAGASTGIGVCETLERYNDSIIFIDEMSIDTSSHLHILKQISNGEIMRPRHRNIDPTLFTGLVISATNAISTPNNGHSLEHLLSVLDRFLVVKVISSNVKPEDALDNIMKDDSIHDCNWSIISNALVRKTAVDLNDNEKELLKVVWNERVKEIIDKTRPQFRNSWAAIDIFLFIKRFFGLDDISKEQWSVDLVKEVISDCIVFNPINILWLDPLEELIYSEIVKSIDGCEIKTLLPICEKSGQLINNRHLRKVLDNMVGNRVIYHNNGRYSIRNNDNVNSINKETQDLINAI